MAEDPALPLQTASSQAKRCESCSRSFADDELFCPVDGAPLVARGTLSAGTDPYVGLILLGQIEIVRLAGAGSMARVYKAFQRGVDRDVAVKILHRELSADPEVVRRFHQEAKVASRLSNPHLVNVFLTAELPKAEGATCGELVLVTEFLDGLSLLSALGAAGGALPLPRALHIVLQMCEALAEAHRQGVVHRDVKPENVMLVQRGEDRDFVKVLDFGLARLASKDASFATRQGAIFGSPKYISPEGAQGLPVGPAADVYAVTTVLYEMLAGRTPFSADTPVGFLLAHTSEAPPRVSSHERASYVPAPIAALLEKNLQKDPKARAIDADALAAEIRLAATEAGFSVEALLRRDAWLGAPGEAAHALASVQRTQTHSLTLEAREAIRPQSPSTSTATGLDEDEGGAPRGHTLVAGEDALRSTLPLVPTLFDAPSAIALGLGTEASTGGRTRLLEGGSSRRRGDAIPDVPALEPPPPRSTRSSGTSHAAASSPLPGPAVVADLRDDVLPSRRGGEGAAVTPRPTDTLPAGTLSDAPRPALSGPDHDSKEPAPLRTIAFVALCFVLGGGTAIAGAARLGAFGREPPAATRPPDTERADQLLSAIAEAEARNEWDGRATSVRELLGVADREHPKDPRFPAARRAMAARLVEQAVAARQRGDTSAAARLTTLAGELDRDNLLAQSLHSELSSEAGRALPPPVPTISTPPLRPPPRPPATVAPTSGSGGKATARWL